MDLQILKTSNPSKVSCAILVAIMALTPFFSHAKASRTDGYFMQMNCKFEIEGRGHYEKDLSVGFHAYTITTREDDWTRAIDIFSESEREQIVKKTSFPLYGKLRLRPDTFRGKQGLNWEISFHKYNRFEKTKTSPMSMSEAALGSKVTLQDRLPNGLSIKLTCY